MTKQGYHHNPKPKKEVTTLTPHRTQILYSLSLGNSMKEVAREFNIKVPSLYITLMYIRRILKAQDTKQAIEIATKRELISHQPKPNQ